VSSQAQQWWGYLHDNGSLQAKRYIHPFGPGDMQDARLSPFCKEVVGPFEATDREDALKKIEKKLKEISSSQK